MRRTIKREIELDEAELKEAVILWLKAKDVPTPADPKDLYFAANFPLSIEVSWIETAHVPPAAIRAGGTDG